MRRHTNHYLPTEEEPLRELETEQAALAMNGIRLQ
jgi:hypothetical protein